jgi:Zn-dependent peptidase ImmA (M78 family)/transcriptional regulator with XRE-family HTH domain
VTGDDAKAVSPVFDPARLRLARELRGLRKGELAAKVSLSPAAIGQFESGAAKPRPATLAQLALTLSFPVGFFATTGEPVRQPDISETFFRSLRSAKQIDRQRAIAFATLVALLLDVLDEHLHLPAVGIPDDLHVAGDVDLAEIEGIAGEVRCRWEVPPGPVNHVVRLLEGKGVAVVRNPSGEEIDAFSAWFKHRPIVVLAADKENFERSRFDATHELGHLVMHSDPAPGDRTLEREAHRFAAAFLMPASDIRDELPSHPVDWRTLVETKRKWGVSLQALLYRARTLGTLSDSAYENAMRTVSRHGWRRQEPGHLGPPERPRLFQAALERLSEIGITRDDLAREANVGVAVIDELVDDTPAQPTVAL